MKTLLATAILLSGCDDGFGGSGGSGFQVNGGSSANGDVFVVWSVASGSPDYAYVHGRGSANGDGFQLSVSVPPADALNSNGVGVGFILLADSPPPEGVLDEYAFEGTVLGGAAEVLVYREDEIGAGLDWAQDFAPGFSCGTCAPAPAGDGFDVFTPIDCADVTIQSGDSFGDCNWT